VKEVYSNADHGRVGFFKSVLDNAGIENFVKNETSYNVTEFSSLIVAPTLCVVNDDDYERARTVIKTAALPPPNFQADWICGACGEEVPGNFDTCWQCGAPAPAAAPSDA
jgi:hypothetical protein